MRDVAGADNKSTAIQHRAAQRETIKCRQDGG
jgi:hypothetical protein